MFPDREKYVHLDVQNISILHMQESEHQTKTQRASVTCPRSKSKIHVRLFDCDLLSNVEKTHMLRDVQAYQNSFYLISYSYKV